MAGQHLVGLSGASAWVWSDPCRSPFAKGRSVGGISIAAEPDARVGAKVRRSKTTGAMLGEGRTDDTDRAGSDARLGTAAYVVQMSSNQELERRASELEETPGRDHALTVALAGLQILPLGGVVAQLLNDYVPRKKQDRLVSFVQALAEESLALGDRLDLDFVHAVEFEGMAEEVFDRAQQHKAEQKLAYFAAALAHGAAVERPDERTRERFMDALDQLRGSHLRLLASVAQGVPVPKAGPDVVTSSQAAIAAVSSAATRAKVDSWDLDWADLARLGIVETLTEAVSDPRVPYDVRAAITPFGREFIRFVTPASVRQAAVAPVGRTKRRP